MGEYAERTYRAITDDGDFASFELTVFETDLKVYLDKSLEMELDRIKPLTMAYAAALRRELEIYIAKNPQFLTTLEPWHDKDVKSLLIKDMIAASEQANVGPMAAVAGTLAFFCARYLQNYSHSVIVENGGDIYVHAQKETVVGVFAGESLLSMKLGLVVPADTPLSICTSSGTVGPSLSMGRADAVCIAAKNAALADALATALGNKINSEADFAAAMAKAKEHKEVVSALFICGNKSAIWGELEIRPI